MSVIKSNIQYHLSNLPFLIQSWSNYFIQVWQIESVISDIQGYSLQLCQLANSLLPSLTVRACTCIEVTESKYFLYNIVAFFYLS
jgi:hypothetical protein